MSDCGFVAGAKANAAISTWGIIFFPVIPIGVGELCIPPAGPAPTNIQDVF
jgi:hypothetical protein